MVSPGDECERGALLVANLGSLASRMAGPAFVSTRAFSSVNEADRRPEDAVSELAGQRIALRVFREKTSAAEAVAPCAGGRVRGSAGP
jgi:hypothetical protein